jgi:hypothetical protein
MPMSCRWSFPSRFRIEICLRLSHIIRAPPPPGLSHTCIFLYYDKLISIRLMMLAILTAVPVRNTSFLHLLYWEQKNEATRNESKRTAGIKKQKLYKVQSCIH